MESSWQIILGVGFVLIIALFFLLQWRSNRTYKPTVDDIRNIIRASVNGTIDIEKFDEFSSVYISYRDDLEAIRNKYNQVVTSADNIDKETAADIVVPLYSVGKQKLRELVNALDALPT